MLRRIGIFLLSILLLVLFILLIWWIINALFPPDPDPPVETNNPPIANDSTFHTLVDEPLTEAFPISDVEDDVLVMSFTQPGANGTAVDNADGNFTYTPDLGFDQTDTFVFQGCDSDNACDSATVTITMLNAPNAADDSYISENGEAVNANVLDNDTPQGQLQVTNVQVDDSGESVTIEPGGAISYQPSDGFEGTVEVTYQACLTSIPTSCDEAQVSIQVFPVNAAQPPNAVADSFEVFVGETLEGNVTSNDNDPADLLPLVVDETAVSSPTHGTLTLGSDGSFTYDPNDDIEDETTDTFSYRVCNNVNVCSVGEVTITIKVMPDEIVHNILEGEWLHQIARCYGTSVSAIVQRNNIVNPDLIYYPGRTLIIPNVGSVGPVTGAPCIDEYIVQPGDTIGSVAQAHGIQESHLRRINDIRFPGFLNVGQRLVLPRPIPDYMQR